MVGRLVLWTILSLLSINSFAEAAAKLLAKQSSCKDHCGSIRIPYPFGMEADHCYVDDWFEIICKKDSTLGTPKPFLKRFNQEVLAISILESTVRVSHRITASCSTTTVNQYNKEFENSPFAFSESNNMFVAMGCNNSASMWSLDGRIIFGGCKCPCDRGRFIHGNRSNGTFNCCQTEIPYDLNAFVTTIEPKVSHNIASVNGECNYAFLVDKDWFQKYFTVPNPNISVPVVLKWGIDPTSYSSKLHGPTSSKQYHCHRHDPTLLGNHNFTISTHTCACAHGYKGNPYLPQGCQDIDECAYPELNHCSNSHCENTDRGHRCTDTRMLIIIGISTILGALFLVIGGWFSYKVVQKRRRLKQKETFFQRNGGLLLQQQLSTREAHVENIKLFNSKDLELATNYFSGNRILGEGGQGTVFKGMLADGRIVAIKKSKLMDEEKLQEFINEVVILSRINHRNVVKLLGCCLETEVPLLVYEFIPNGTLSQYLNDQNEEFPLTWDMRLRIATEVAGSLFYLHSTASSPIYHRDIKSANILLDEKLKAKVADFGISRFVAIDQTHLSTQVQGTFGYIDPEYYGSGQFTEKSDVYSFGVVLAELLTREKPISSTRTSKTKSLAIYFITSMEENNLFGILDNRILKEAKKEEIIVVANLVKRCLSMKGKNRPTMKEVAMELELVQMLQKDSIPVQNYEEEEIVRTDKMYDKCDAVNLYLKKKGTDIDVGSSLDPQPLLSS
ncbi:wall-associated receptor kinase-like 8 [Juglans microcarpa x Juglans regia]|uniref:wall-associated receptor kinase-like 8 n=1 Tax=Juglans microcarpa x Juglans regia TaxID=2249226 RepID=UPI001B7F2B3B|nr:wall-associated receptor kinase-like 8 [Juglans microcarpa x Juglans regia]